MDEHATLIARVSEYCREADISVVQNALEVATQAYQGKVRYSGALLVSHCVAVADILASWHAPVEVVAAGLLHNALVRDYSGMSVETLTSTFGTKITHIVSSVTNLRRFGLTFSPRLGETPIDFETFTQRLPWVVQAIQDEPDAMVIRIADRLENLRTIQRMPSVKQAEFIAGVSR